MKTITNKTNLILSLVLLLSSYFLASAAIINISTSPEVISMETNSPFSDFEKAMSVNFDFEDECYINDIPVSTVDTSSKDNFNKAISIDFKFEEESYIDDIPFEKNNMVL